MNIGSASKKCLLFAGMYAGVQLLGVSNVHADDAIERGKTIFTTTGACSSCHGPEGKGDGPAGAALTPKPRNFSVGDFAYDTNADGKKGTEEDLFNIISNGAQKYGGSFMMVGRPDLPEDDRKALAKYVLSLKK